MDDVAPGGGVGAGTGGIAAGVLVWSRVVTWGRHSCLPAKAGRNAYPTFGGPIMDLLVKLLGIEAPEHTQLQSAELSFRGPMPLWLAALAVLGAAAGIA